jgi:hypothetical protein
VLSAFVVGVVLTTGCRQCGTNAGSPEATRTTVLNSKAPSGAMAPTPVSAKAPAGGWPNARSSLGTGLSGVADWSSEIPFIDAFHASRAFVSGSPQAWGDDRKLDVDARGWLRSLAPNQEARTVVLNGPQFRSGRYLVLYEGRGEHRYAGSTAQLDTAASRPGRDVVMVDRARGDLAIAMDILSIDPSDPIRNIRIIPPGGACDADRARFCDADNPCPTGACLEFEQHYEQLVFHPDFLARIQRYGMLRFMDMMQTNNSDVVRWDQRGQLGNQTWAINGGVPLEVMAKLANQMHAEPWFNIPHQADDEYIRNFAEQVKALVDPELPIWIEYSNEVWNSSFQQHIHALKGGEKLGHRDFEAVLRFYAKRTLDIFKVFEEVLGKDRVKTVVGTHVVNTWVTEQILDYPGLAERADALAVAPYFGWSVMPDDLPKLQKMTLEQLMAQTESEYIPTTKKWIADQSEMAKKYDLELVAYEAGQHYVGVAGAENDEHLNKLFDDINRHPRMKDFYLTYLENWKAAGGTWLNHFVNCDKWSKWGRWGALEEIRQPREQSPKFDALMTFMDKHERWW